MKFTSATTNRCFSREAWPWWVDSPINLDKAVEAGLLGAGLIYPWNEKVPAPLVPESNGSFGIPRFETASPRKKHKQEGGKKIEVLDKRFICI